MLTVGSLFAGIGGFDLGFERAGMRTVWQVEQDEFCRRVLARHFPSAERFVDVRDVGAHNLAPADVICGGFPCQDISVAGKGAGLDGARSGLWSEYARIVGELRPRYVVVENVSALLGRGLGTVLGDLAARGYDAEWDCIPASAVGAPHRRDRVWIVAYPRSSAGRTQWPTVSRVCPVAHIERRGEHGELDGRSEADTAHGRPQRTHADGLCTSVADSDRKGSQGWGLSVRARSEVAGTRNSSGEEWWTVEPDVGRVAYGVPARVDRLRALGNALVPQIAEWIGSRIVEYEGAARVSS